MPKAFDAAIKELVRHRPADWLGLIGVVPVEEPVWEDAELSTVSASADRFDIVRVWQLPAADLLRAPVGVLPLAVLGQPPKGQSRQQALPGQVDRIIDRAVAEAGEQVGEVVTAAFLLAGMHQDNAFLRAIFHRGLTMIESSAFQVIEDLAKEKYAREMLLMQGTIRFGPPTQEQAEKLAAIENLPRLNRLAARLLKVNSWDALLKGR